MAQKKKKNQQPKQQLLSPAKYIRLKARTLPIDACYINSDWQQAGIACIVVSRQHESGNFSIGTYLVDTFCLGVKNATYYFNVTQCDLDELLDQTPRCKAITYHEVHNIIYGAIAYAQEEAGIAPHPDFEIAQYLLEEDTDDIPLIEYDFGQDGKPFLAVKTKLEASKYLSKLQQRYGDDFPFIIAEDYEDMDDEEEFEDIDEEDDLLTTPYSIRKHFFSIKKTKEDEEKVKTMIHTTYAYNYPVYPQTLEPTHQELIAIYNNDYFYRLPRNVIEELLALPRESLIADLNHIILYELGASLCNITQDMIDQYCNTVTHAVFLLGELRATESFDIVMEILHQRKESLDYHFGDACTETLCLTLYYLGRTQTDKLLAFMKEPGLYSYARSYAAQVMVFICVNEPERREEVIDWFRQLLHFFIANASDSTVYDATLVGAITVNLVDIRAKELLPELKELYDTQQVDFTFSGLYEDMESEILDEPLELGDYDLNDIYKRYEAYEDGWGY